jgi:hypothetical protein
MCIFCVKFQVLNYFVDCYDACCELRALVGRPSATLPVFPATCNNMAESRNTRTQKLYVIADIGKV